MSRCSEFKEGYMTAMSEAVIGVPRQTFVDVSIYFQAGYDYAQDDISFAQSIFRGQGLSDAMKAFFEQ